MGRAGGLGGKLQDFVNVLISQRAISNEIIEMKKGKKQAYIRLKFEAIAGFLQETSK